MTYPPRLADNKLAEPTALSSRSRFASCRVSSSIPVVLSSTVITVTNIMATMSPASEESAGQGNRLNSSKFQGSLSATAASGLNSQPAACASVIEMPVAKKARCAAAIPANISPSRTSGFLKRRNPK